MRRGQPVRYEQLNRAVKDVQDELERVGLWYEGSLLTQTDVFWCWFPQIQFPGALGFFIEQVDGLWAHICSLWGYEAGHIYIPSWVLLQGPWQDRGSLRDIIRHEYGHALMWHHPELGRSSDFKDVFHGRYDSGDGYLMFPNCYVSDYAMTKPAEDFAETFMCYLRNPEKKWGGPKLLRKKFEFVKRLCEKVG